jgi:hypothetical protein
MEIEDCIRLFDGFPNRSDGIKDKGTPKGLTVLLLLNIRRIKMILVIFSGPLLMTPT